MDSYFINVLSLILKPNLNKLSNSKIYNKINYRDENIKHGKYIYSKSTQNPYKHSVFPFDRDKYGN